MSQYQYSDTMRRKVACAVAQGKALEALAGTETFPRKFATLWRWYCTLPAFRAAVDEAQAFHARGAVQQFVAVAAEMAAKGDGEAAVRACKLGLEALRLGGPQLVLAGFGAAALPAPLALPGPPLMIEGPRVVIEGVGGVPAADDPDGGYDF